MLFTPILDCDAPDAPGSGTADVRDLAARAGGILDTLDPDSVPLPEALDLWTAFGLLERHASAAKLLLTRRVAEGRAWVTAGCRSPEEHLALLAGCSVSNARGELVASRQLALLDATQTALRAGEISGAQAAVVAGAATVNPRAEAGLLDVARRSSMSELHTEALRAKAKGDPDPDATHRRINSQRYLRSYTDAEGAWNLAGRGTAECGALVRRALDRLIDEMFHTARAKGEQEPIEAYAFDALVRLARQSGGSGSVDGSGTVGDAGPSVDQAAAATGDHNNDSGNDTNDECAGNGDGVTTTSTPDADDLAAHGNGDNDSGGSGAATTPGPSTEPVGRPSRARTTPSYLALLRIDLEALVRGSVEGDETCEIADIGPVPARVARNLLGDSILKLVITRGKDVANITHLGRGPTVAQRMALLWTSPTCTVEGCNRTRLEADHRVDWAHTHHTRLDELANVCEHHHDLKTRENWALVEGTGKRPMVPPDDPRHPRNQPGTGPDPP